MKNQSPYLEIYQEGEIVIQYSEKFENEKEKNDFFDYLNYLKDNNINFCLLDKNGEKIYEYLANKNSYNFNKNFNFQKKVQDNIKNILLLENNIELKNEDGKIIEFVSKEKLKEILENNNLEIKLKNKLEQILELLNKGFSKVTMCPIDGIKEELEGFGSGTMFVDLEKASFTKLKKRELFDEIYLKQIIAGKWKSRTEEELDNIFNNYTVLEIDGTILGGYSLRNFKINIDGKELKGKILENLFSSINRGGVGNKLMEQVKLEQKVFAYSKEEYFFEKMGFKRIKGQNSETGADLWIYEKS